MAATGVDDDASARAGCGPAPSGGGRLGSIRVKTRGVQVLTPQGETIDLYSASYALLIGNSEYEHWDTLEWPTSDVDDVAETLGQLGFETEVHKNLQNQQFHEGWGSFSLHADERRMLSSSSTTPVTATPRRVGRSTSPSATSP